MGRMIAEFGGRYVEWSSVVDAPTTYLMTEEELKTFLLQEYGYKDGLQDLNDRLERVRKTGTSSRMRETKESLLRGNHAGEKGANIATEAEMVAKYTQPSEEASQAEVDVSKPIELVDSFGYLGVRAPVVEILNVTGACVLARVKLAELEEPVIVLFDTMTGSVLTKNFVGDFKVQNVETTQ